ncbi:MAG: cysteine desulfurase [Acidobacteriia bacterium]|nr:cysteine desulfurase [Terriglobia bacterium]
MRAARKVSEESAAGVALDVQRIREDFPILKRRIHGKPLVYLDSAASTQKPLPVIEAMTQFYAAGYSNIHRGVYLLSEEATEAYESARARVSAYVGARESREIVFVRGTTEAINLVAQTWGRVRVGAGDEILVSGMEHHSNIVPWQILCQEKGARLVVIPIDDRGDLVFEEFERLLSPRTRIVAVAHVSNALGTVNPIRRIVEVAHGRGVPVLVDGAQAVAHQPVDVEELGCDFYAFSGHKLYGPTGVGVLYGRAEFLEAMPPYQGGGDMIRSVTFEKTTYNDIPHKFEAGTPDIGGAVVLGAAIDYVSGIGLEAIAAHEADLLDRATRLMESVPRVRIIGTARKKAGVLSFVVEGIHPHDVGTVLDNDGIAIRAGHLCAQPVMERFGVPATARASFGMYNTREEIEIFAEGIRRVIEVFG